MGGANSGTTRAAATCASPRTYLRFKPRRSLSPIPWQASLRPLCCLGPGVADCCECAAQVPVGARRATQALQASIPTSAPTVVAALCEGVPVAVPPLGVLNPVAPSVSDTLRGPVEGSRRRRGVQQRARCLREGMLRAHGCEWECSAHPGGVSGGAPELERDASSGSRGALCCASSGSVVLGSFLSDGVWRQFQPPS